MLNLLKPYFYINTLNKSVANVFASRTCVTNLAEDVLLSQDNRQRTIQCLKQSAGLNYDSKTSEEAAVLIVLCTSSNDTSILYTRRSVHMSRHARQISFPGGMRDNTDTDYVDCALRELEEEVGLSRNRVEIWGKGKLIKPPRTAAIMPVIGVVRNLNKQELTVNEREVEEVFTIPVAKLVEPAFRHHTQFKSGYSSPAFIANNYRIWGVTGFLTQMFLKCFIPPVSYSYQRRTKFIKPFLKKD